MSPLPALAHPSLPSFPLPLPCRDRPPPPAPFPPTTCPLFVTWNIFQPARLSSRPSSAQLRGCIGTFSPRSLDTGLADFALTSALHDSRFPPITLDEVPRLQCGVSLLHSFEPANHWSDWEIGRHGTILRLGRGTRGVGRELTATFLPDVALEQGWDHEETVQHLLHKAGYRGPVDEEVFDLITVERYQSSKVSTDHADYVARSPRHDDDDDEADA